MSEPEFILLHREQRLSAQAAEQIAHMIMDQQFPVGARLPSERQLASALGVSRTVVREAIRLLEARKLVEVQTGSGAVVLGVSPAPVTESINMLLGCSGACASFDDVQAVRSVLEMATASLAASKATEDDLALMRDALDRMLSASTVEEQIQADYDFHLAIARATHNEVFVLLLQALNDVVIETWRVYWAKRASLGPSDYLAVDKQQNESDLHHRQVYEAIRARDSETARKATERMLVHWSAMYSGQTAPHEAL